MKGKLKMEIPEKISPFRNSSRNFPFNDSTYPFSHGLPGSMNKVFTPTRSSQFRTNRAVNSDPLSERR